MSDTCPNRGSEPEIDMDGISRCWHNNGYHWGGAGPCFDELEHAIAYREYVKEHGYQL